MSSLPALETSITRREEQTSLPNRKRLKIGSRPPPSQENLTMESSYALSVKSKIYVGIDKTFNIIIRFGANLSMNVDTFKLLTQTCRGVFDTKYSAYLGPISVYHLTVILKFSSKKQVFPSSITILNTINENNYTFGREAFLNITEFLPAIRFKIQLLNDLCPIEIFKNMRIAYAKSKYFDDNVEIKVFINSYLDKIPVLHALYLSECLAYFPIQLYNSLLANEK